MTHFTDLTSEESKDLDKQIYNNALKLKDDAILLFNENKSFSSATSLLVLSSEEVIKASLVLLHSEGFNVYKLQDAKKFFYDHKIRHQIVQLIEIGTSLSESIEKWSKRKPTKKFKQKYDFLNITVDILKASKPTLKSVERINKLFEFNNLKNNGLYVGFKDKLIVPKVVVSERDYLEVIEIVDRVFNFYIKLINIFKNIPASESERRDQNETKERLRMFIDEAMSDFSFKDLNKNLG